MRMYSKALANMSRSSASGEVKPGCDEAREVLLHRTEEGFVGAAEGHPDVHLGEDFITRCLHLRTLFYQSDVGDCLVLSIQPRQLLHFVEFSCAAAHGQHRYEVPDLIGIVLVRIALILYLFVSDYLHLMHDSFLLAKSVPFIRCLHS